MQTHNRRVFMLHAVAGATQVFEREGTALWHAPLPPCP